jgi:hypothetical protein
MKQTEEKMRITNIDGRYYLDQEINGCFSSGHITEEEAKDMIKKLNLEIGKWKKFLIK